MTDPDRARAHAEVVRILRAEPWQSAREVAGTSGGTLTHMQAVVALGDLEASGAVRSRLSPPPRPPRRYALARAGR